jgi:hypothetical protein
MRVCAEGGAGQPCKPTQLRDKKSWISSQQQTVVGNVLVDMARANEIEKRMVRVVLVVVHLGDA